MFRKFLCSILFCSAAFAGAAEEFRASSGGRVWFYEIEDGEAVIRGLEVPNRNKFALTIPSRIGGFSVKRVEGLYVIVPDGWGVYDVITSVNLPGTLREIGVAAFVDCPESITTVTIPKSVTVIGASAFYTCHKLKSITIPEGVTQIGVGAFKYSGLTSVTIPQSVEYLGRGAFAQCSDLKTALVPESLRQTVEAGGIFDEGVVIRYYGGSGYVRVSSEEPRLGTVSGGNASYSAGKKVPVTAKPAKGAAFGGWYLDGNLVSESPSFQYLATGEAQVSLVAHFRAAADDWLYVDSIDSLDTEIGETVDLPLEDVFSIDSGSAKKITISKLPRGIKYDAKAGRFSGKPTKAETSFVECSVKNANGFSMSAFCTWTVGGGSSLGDYDNIGIDWDALEQGIEWRTGEWVGISFFFAMTDDRDSLMEFSASGLPTGLAKAVCQPGLDCGYTAGTYHGTLTKSGTFKVSLTAKYMDGTTRKCVHTIVVKDGGSRWLNVAAASPWRGSVTGSNVYKLGSKARITAKPTRGYVFAGWYLDEDCTEPAEGDIEKDAWQNASATLVVTDNIANSGIYAKFISKDEDEITIECADVWKVAAGGYDWFNFNVNSGTKPTVSVKGLPSGIKFVKDSSSLAAVVSKLKPGVTMASITVRNLSGRTASKNISIMVPNIESSVFSGLDYSEPYHVYVGVGDYCGFFCSFDYDPSWSVSASGLPPGLSLYAVRGSCDILGTATKAGAYTVTLKAKRGNETQKATFAIVVDPLPEWAIGTFNGFISNGSLTGALSMTTTSSGRMTVKITAEGKTFNLSETCWNCEYDGEFTAYIVKSGSHSLILSITETGWNELIEDDRNKFSYEDYRYGGEYSIVALQRSPFAKSGSSYENPEAFARLREAEGTYRVECPDWNDIDRSAHVLCDDAYGNMKLVVKADGSAILSGRDQFSTETFTAKSTVMFDGDEMFVIFCPIIKQHVPGSGSKKLPYAMPFIYRF